MTPSAGRVARVGSRNDRKKSIGGTAVALLEYNPHKEGMSNRKPIRKKVWRTPNSGMSASAGKKEPKILPKVESAKSFPAAFPDDSMSDTPKRIAQGETIPIRVTGMANKISVPIIPPTTVAIATCGCGASFSV